ncbi:MAG: GNAT family N-acetyltransferase [Candidatus Marinimicrobia bacterium]|nr:GNAT family N-acetyltransferase [Candidatus Neomarinimicrobiota bacterium]MBT3848882.1 GNAT family N-acetyltransferase [Candidatus Neomarinimicrobiota bacterium]MBT4055292.1 GNAT family N-acetyltransferase [Candidatus Neomarinimicrobiota bacterium]MBT4370651.1 GNAT family N-acetyltransferase [Candidatus Neomarinimicrobiota bacterium]MBT4827380.1 GNAT family N-acetyltransferase [Candidatus Neomarinimicrobiota bacterium]
MIHIRKGAFQECVDLSSKIPEFTSPYKIEVYKKRCAGKYLALIAEIDNQSVGFKIGYDRLNDGSFYSWMGGVLPKFRRMGVAYSLANFQEKWATNNKFSSILLKTRQKHDGMIAFSLNRGFIITEETQITPAEETRIWMQKSLNH